MCNDDDDDNDELTELLNDDVGLLLLCRRFPPHYTDVANLTCGRR